LRKLGQELNVEAFGGFAGVGHFCVLGKNYQEHYNGCMTAEDIERHLKEKSLIWTEHIFKKFIERNITMNDVIVALGNGEIIEQYPNDYPFPSCLVLGRDASGQILHVVCGSDGAKSILITAYSPSLFKWMDDFKQRRKI